ncbi:MAG: NADH-ubiquinone oxidoreductase-F iron-sulfur binding region domain-containing protein [Anaerolineales bacterium]|nr:NADH-ubiquinone oxidoreductase-F iron-sulfur binding region domain-containing protein [Anaerolineales bacterium]
MPRLLNGSDWTRVYQSAQEILQQRQKTGATIFIGMGTCGIAAGAAEIEGLIRQELISRNLQVEIVPVGCIGMCFKEPLVDIQLPRQPRVTYSNVKPEMVPRIIDEHLVKGKIVNGLAFGQLITEDSTPKIISANLPEYSELPFYHKQIRIALRNCGMIDPQSIESYIANEGYRALTKALTEMNPDGVINEVKSSGLRGRGGAGFLTGAKWEFCRKAIGDPKYIICNADEGDPGAFMDRSILEGDPHAVLEGMIIAGYAIGAREGYIYCRAEYPLAIAHLKTALAQAHEYGLLGENILGSGFSFDLHVYEGAGAFVCGEETALMASIEGRRGEPRPRPPFPAVSGLWNKPSNVNNVKSYALAPPIILKGAEWFTGIGTKKSPGTAIFALTGQIKNTGLIEVPMGITLREIIYDVGGGVPKKKHFKAVQTGGPLGGCLPEAALDTPVDFDSLVQAGATMGSGGMIVVDQDTCMVEFAKYFLTFASAESCGKCIPCRIGGQRLLEILTRISEGNGTLQDLSEIERLSNNMREASLCALGQLTPGPIMSALRFFLDEYKSHIVDHFCPAGVCKGMFSYEILAENCAGCTLCFKPCPVGAISGAKKEVHTIDQLKCTQCGVCYQVCNLKAIAIKPPLETTQAAELNQRSQ